MVELARWVALAGLLAGIVAVPARGGAAEPSAADAEKNAAPEKKAEAKPEGKPDDKGVERPDDKPRGPAEDLVLEASFGYGGGPFTAIAGHDPKVAHGPAMHFAAGWAWTVKANQSLGLEFAFEGNFDSGSVTGGTRRVAPRFMGYAFVMGEYAHVRVGAGHASSRFDAGNYSGLSVGFAAGWNVPILPAAKKSWKRPYVTFDIAPTWDFLNAGSETLNRWTVSALIGVGIY